MKRSRGQSSAAWQHATPFITSAELPSEAPHLQNSVLKRQGVRVGVGGMEEGVGSGEVEEGVGADDMEGVGAHVAEEGVGAGDMGGVTRCVTEQSETSMKVSVGADEC